MQIYTLSRTTNGSATLTIQKYTNHMKNNIFQIVALSVACLIPSISRADESGTGEKKAPDPIKIMEKLDADKSGTLSAGEVTGNKSLKKRFEKLDLNNDAALDMDELKAGLVKKPKKAKSEE
jgi:hypothetical protein